MPYKTLYRKYRPYTFDNVIDQDVVIKILKNAIINNKIAHAYLFSGPRGIGKTSIAKIFARTINCLNPIDGINCGKCNNCELLNNSYSPDIIEIDAASNNGVDEIREIKNNINLVPSELKYKVYIIDEVHMLSIGAFNALLKTLEEPPEHIIFILATTDVQKVPSTIISRCQCFEFNRISNDKITELLLNISEKENINVDKSVLENISLLSDGGLRDAIGMLDKLNAYSNSKITVEDFEIINGIVSINEKNKFIDYIYNSKINEFITFLDKIYNNGKNLETFVRDILNIIKNKIIDYYINNKKIYDINFLLSFSNCLNELLMNSKNIINYKTTLEIKLLNYINNNNNNNNNNNDDDFNKNITDNNDKIISREIISKEDNNNLNINFDNIINNCFVSASKDNKNKFQEKWNNLSEYSLDNNYGSIANYLLDGNICVVGDNEVCISFKRESMVNRGINLIFDIEKFIEMVYNKHYDVAIISDEKWSIEKNNFVKNQKKGYKYEYIPINKDSTQKINEKSNSLTKEALEIFGDSLVEFN